MAGDCEPRPISAEEVAVIRAAFAQGQVLINVSPAALEALPSLTVVSGCPCGCASVTFAEDPSIGRVSALVVDAVARHPDGSLLGLMVWGHPDQITGLELYDYDASGGYKRLPDPASVRSFYRS
jgi:hypothetical protein